VYSLGVLLYESLCHRHQKRPAEEAADEKRYKGMESRTAWDYFLPGHTAGWHGDLEEAIRSYQAAIRVQPDHINSLFYLACRLSRPKINRVPEAIQLCTACIALRPSHIYAHINRADCYEQLGKREEAEADYSGGIAAASNKRELVWTIEQRCAFYQRTGSDAKFKKDSQRLLAVEEQLFERWKTAFVSDQEEGFDEQTVRYYRALLRLRAGDADGYRDICASMLKRWGTSDLTLWTCVMAPNAVGDPMALANGAEMAVGKEPKGHLFANLLGAALYRAGRYDEAQ
jgi:tetratricopeptide (TPR) repeat protein